MTSNIVSTNQSDSPFDSIRKYRADGSEYWSARELMTVLTYTKWQKFKDVIDIAKENIETIDSNSFRHFLPVEVKSLGRNAIDFELSRLACYHVALASDSRGKDAVKMAKHYFVVKTREAEVIVPSQELEIIELKIELAKIESQKLLSENQLLQFRHYVTTALPEFQQQKILGYEVVEKVETRDRVINESGYILNDGSTATKKELCIRLGFLSKSGLPDYKRLNYYLDKLPHVAFEDVAIVQENRQLRRDWIAELEAMVNDGDRQKWIGE